MFRCSIEYFTTMPSRNTKVFYGCWLPANLGVKWVSTANYQIFLFKICILSPKWPSSGLKNHKIIAYKSFLRKIFSTDQLFCM